MAIYILLTNNYNAVVFLMLFSYVLFYAKHLAIYVASYSDIVYNNLIYKQ